MYSSYTSLFIIIYEMSDIMLQQLKMQAKPFVGYMGKVPGTIVVLGFLRR